MKVSGKRTFTLSQLTKLELLVIRAALNDYYKKQLEGCDEGWITTQGEIALGTLNQLNEHADG